jgi:hypothetical protein
MNLTPRIERGACMINTIGWAGYRLADMKIMYDHDYG